VPKNSTPTDEMDLVATAEVAALCGVNHRTVNRWVESGRLTPAGKVPGLTGAHFFHREDALRLKATRPTEDVA
jgi:DNA-binding transcriptional MerR regulator